MTVGCSRSYPLPQKETGGRGKTVTGGIRRIHRVFWALAGLMLALSFATSSRAALQFDVFLGYDGVVPEGAWFPVMFEVKNDGPTFVGTVELDGGTYNQGQVRRMIVELPTGTLK